MARQPQEDYGLAAAQEAVCAEVAHLVSKLGFQMFTRRLAWPTYDWFLPMRFPESDIFERRITDHRSASSDEHLRLGFAHNAHPTAYYAREFRFSPIINRGSHPDKDAFVEDIRKYDWPLFSLDELASVINQFADHLCRDRSSTCATGYPNSKFRVSKWFHNHFSALHFTRIPLYVLNHDDGCRAESEYTYLWPSEPGTPLLAPEYPSSLQLNSGAGPGFSYGRGWKAYTTDAKLVEAVPYENAPVLPGLSSAVADMLDQSRDKWLELRIHLLRELSKALYRRDSSNLRNNCLRILVKNMSAEECDVCRHLDVSYLLWFGPCYSTTSYFLIRGSLLVNMLMLTGHCESELTIGRLHKTREELADLIIQDDQGKFSGSVTDYGEIVGRPEQNLVDSAHGVFHGLADAEADHWRGFLTWMGDAYNEFYSSYLGQKVKRKHLGEMREYVQNLVKLGSASLELTGQLPGIDSPKISVGDTATVPSDLVPFQHSKDFRSAYFRGQEFSFTRMQAMVIKFLWEAYQNGTPEVGQDYILNEVVDTTQTRLRDVFKNHPAWNVLVVSGNTKGTVRLKI